MVVRKPLKNEEKGVVYDDLYIINKYLEEDGDNQLDCLSNTNVQSTSNDMNKLFVHGTDYNLPENKENGTEYKLSECNESQLKTQSDENLNVESTVSSATLPSTFTQEIQDSEQTKLKVDNKDIKSTIEEETLKISTSTEIIDASAPILPLNLYDVDVSKISYESEVINLSNIANEESSIINICFSDVESPVKADSEAKTTEIKENTEENKIKEGEQDTFIQKNISTDNICTNDPKQQYKVVEISNQCESAIKKPVLNCTSDIEENSDKYSKSEHNLNNTKADAHTSSDAFKNQSHNSLTCLTPETNELNNSHNSNIKNSNLDVKSIANKKQSKAIVNQNSKYIEFDLHEVKKKTNRHKPKYTENIHEIGDVDINQSPLSNKRDQITDFRNNADFQANSFQTVSSFLNGLRKNDASPIHANRTYLTEIENGFANIDCIKDYEDVRYKSIFGRLHFYENTGEPTENFIKVENSTFVCYDVKKTQYVASTDPLNCFRCNDDPGYCYLQKFKIDLKQARLLVSVGDKPSFSLWQWLCCASKEKRESLYNIINIHIHKIALMDDKYRLYLTNDENSNFIVIKSLKFILFSAGVYYTFESKQMMNFLKWTTAITVRHEQD